MQTLPILPDEYLFGYLGRLTRSLGLQPVHREFSKAVQTGIASRDVPCPKEVAVEMLAQRAGSDIKTITQRHTLAPAYMAFSASEGETYFDSGERRFSRHVLGPRFAAPRFCTLCTEEDLAFWSCSYWRRTHQLPGLSHCHKHEHTLATADAPLAIQFQPHHYVESHGGLIRKSSPSTVERRMATIWEGLIDHGRPIHYKKAVELLNNGRIVDGKQAVRGFDIRKLVESSTQKNWIEEHFSSYSKKNIFRRSHQEPSADYVFVLSMLYENPDEVVSVLTMHSNKTIRKQEPCPRRRKIPHDTQIAMDAFRSGLSLREVLALQNPSQRNTFERHLRDLLQTSQTSYSK